VRTCSFRLTVIETWIVIAFAVAILGYGLSPLIGGYKPPEKPMAAVKGNVRNLGEFLKSRGVDLEEVEQVYAATEPRRRDSYENKVKPTQCMGFITAPNVSPTRALNPDWSDRCRKKTAHPSGLCAQHRRRVR
jgi:hypothetical protein